jgi:hypothetical protein
MRARPMETKQDDESYGHRQDDESYGHDREAG